MMIRHHPLTEQLEALRQQSRITDATWAAIIVGLSVTGWGVLGILSAGLYALALFVWSWAEALATIIGIGVSLATIVIGLGLPN